MTTEDIRKLEKLEVVVVTSLVERRDRLVREAQAAIDAQNEALTNLAQDYADGDGTYRFDGRPDGVWLVRVIEDKVANGKEE